MLKFVALFCIISVANAGILSPSIGIAAAPAIVSAPTILRTAPAVAVGTIGAPLGISTGLISNGIVSNGLISNGLVGGGLISNGIVGGGLISNGIVGGGLIAKGGLVSGGLVGAGKLLI